MKNEITNKLENEIVATLAFFNTFEKALTVEELFENLYRENPMSETKTEEQIISALQSLEARGLVDSSQTENGVAMKLTGEQTVDRTKYNRKLMSKVHRWSWIFKLCPFLELVGVCNTLGFNAAKEGSDIDLFIVTTQKRLFLGRTFVTLLTHICGLRRHGQQISERFCLSFLVDASDQAVHKLAFENDIYFTYWLKNLRIVYARSSESIEDFSGNNKYWVSKYLHHPNPNTEEVREGKKIVARFVERLLQGRIGDFAENLLRNWQLNRARRKAALLPDLTGTVLSDTILKFHNIDRRREINEKWNLNRKR